MCDEQQANARYFAAHFDTNKCFNRLDYLMGFALGVEAAYSKQEAEGTLDIIVTTPTDVLATTKGIPKNTHHYSASADNAAVSAGFVDGNNVGRGDALPHADGGAFADMPVFNYGA